jgi:hypothetical protein
MERTNSHDWKIPPESEEQELQTLAAPGFSEPEKRETLG